MSSAPWTSTILQKPQTPLIFSLLPTSHLPLSSSRNIHFHKRSHNLTVKPLHSSNQPLYDNVSPQDEYEDDEEPAIGDCLVYEEGIFNDPFLENTRNPRHSDPRTTNIKDADVSQENLIPEEWLDVQEELNITKKERRKMAQELEYGRRVEKRRQALLPLNSEEFEKAKQEKRRQAPMSLESEAFEKLKQEKRRQAPMSLESEAFEKLKQEKLKQLSPVVLDNPKKAYFRENEKRDEDTSGEVSRGRVAPRNPRLAVYGGGLEDVSALFSSGKYDNGASDRSQGTTRKLFSNEEKSIMNRRVPDIALATSGKWHPLHTLAAAGEFYLINSLLKHNLDMNTPDKNGLTVIHKAILSKKQAIFNFLLRESANPFVRDNRVSLSNLYKERVAREISMEVEHLSRLIKSSQARKNHLDALLADLQQTSTSDHTVAKTGGDEHAVEEAGEHASEGEHADNNASVQVWNTKCQFLVFARDNVDLRYLHLVDDLDVFLNFPWGTVSYNFLVRHMHRAAGIFASKESTRIPLYGFMEAFQVRVYEVFPNVGREFANNLEWRNDRFSRILQWSTARCPSTEIIQPHFTVDGGFEMVLLRMSKQERGDVQKLWIKSPRKTPKTAPAGKKRARVCKKLSYNEGASMDIVIRKLGDICKEVVPPKKDSPERPQ